MVQKGYWAILPFEALSRFTHLKLSPAGVVPQRMRRPRPIMDYSYTDVNKNSIPLSPWHAMQLGHTLPRLLQRIAYADPAHGPPLLLKFDLADGYYRVKLTPEAALELLVVLPGPTKNTRYVGIPLSLPMGWSHSPPYFCAFTETATDLANQALSSTDHPWDNLEHDLEVTSQLAALPSETAFRADVVHPPTLQSNRPLAFADVYIDDFIGLAQQPTAARTLRILLNAISHVFRHDTHPDDRSVRKQTISASKLAQGDGCWSTTKVILGWELDTAAGTIRLPDHKAQRLLDLLQSFDTLGRTSRKKWYSLLGELRHMSTAIKGASYLFSILQSVLTDQPNATRVRLSPLVHNALHDWRELANTLASHPVPIASLVPRAPAFIGAVDASQQGIGGFWVPTRFGHMDQPIAFRYAFPTDIQSRLISSANPTGTLSNSDFELAAIILGCSILAQQADIHNDAIWCASDNTPAVAWCTRGSTSSTKPNAFLLRWLASLTRTHSFTLQPISVPGISNALADFCSRSFHLSNSAFLQALQLEYPTSPSWKVVRPTSANVSAMISAMSSIQSPLALPPADRPQPLPPGPYGKPSVENSTPTLHWQPQPNPSYYSKYSPIVTVGEKYLPAALKSAVKRWATPFAPLDRRYPTWASTTPDYYPRVNYTFV